MKTIIVRGKHTVWLYSLLLFLFMVPSVKGQDGKAIFKSNCASCHSTSKQKLVGPGLEGVTERRKPEWLIKWVKNSQELISSGDADAKAVFEEFGKSPMPPFSQLKDEEITALFEYVKTASSEVAAPNAATKTAEVKKPVEVELSAGIWMLIVFIVLLLIVIVIYTWNLSLLTRRLGARADTIPFNDQFNDFMRKNGKLVLFLIIIFILFVMKSCVQGLMG